MAYFHSPQERAPRQLNAGVMMRSFWGERMLAAVIDLDANAVIPPHSHPHEQIGILLSGELEFTVADETRIVRPGDLWVIPGDVVHSVIAGPVACQALEMFAPVREEYK
jgi:quercetin dioxygenase-like cupin family protein